MEGRRKTPVVGCRGSRRLPREQYRGGRLQELAHVRARKLCWVPLLLMAVLAAHMAAVAAVVVLAVGAVADAVSALFPTRRKGTDVVVPLVFAFESRDNEKRNETPREGHQIVTATTATTVRRPKTEPRIPERVLQTLLLLLQGTRRRRQALLVVDACEVKTLLRWFHGRKRSTLCW